MEATPIDLIAGSRDSPDPRGAPPGGVGAARRRTALGVALRLPATRTIRCRSPWRPRMPTGAPAPRPAPDQGSSGGAPPDHAFLPRLHRVALAFERRRHRSATRAHPHVRPPGVAAGAAARAAGRRRRFGAHGPAPQGTRRRLGRTPHLFGAGGAHPPGRPARPRCRPPAKRAPHHPRTPRGRLTRSSGARSFDTEQPGKANDNDTLARGIRRAAPRAD